MVDFEKYRELSTKLNELTNAAWMKVNGLTLADVINGEVDLRKLDRAVMDLSSKCNEMSRTLSREMDRLSEDDYDRLDREYMEVDDLFSKVDSKLSVIDSIISDLKSIQDDCEEEECAKKFSDIKVIRLGESLRLRRFN
jgi:hypothetical protein